MYIVISDIIGMIIKLIMITVSNVT